MFLLLLQLLLVVTWIACLVGIVAWGVWTWRVLLHEDRGLGIISMVAFVIAFGFTLITPLALLSGQLSFGHPDGCYRLSTIPVGKSAQQVYDPIQCPAR